MEVMDLTAQVNAVADGLFKILYKSEPRQFGNPKDQSHTTLITIRELGRTWEIKLEWNQEGVIYAHFFHYKSGYTILSDIRFTLRDRHCICWHDIKTMAFRIIRDCNIAIYS